MAPWADETVDSSQEIVRRGPRWKWLAGAGIFVVGVAVGALGLHLGESDRPDPSVGGSAVVGCGAMRTLVLEVDDLSAGSYELRASVGDRMLPMINSMTYPIVGTHRGHQTLVPDRGRLLLVANVPVGRGNSLRYELVGNGAEPVAGGSLPTEVCNDSTTTSTTSTTFPAPPRGTETFAEFLVEIGGGGFVFERVDRSTPEPVEAKKDQVCYADPGWTFNGAPYDNGDRVATLPSGVEQGTVNDMGQCTFGSDN